MADVVVINAPALVSLEPGHPEVHASLRAAADRCSRGRGGRGCEEMGRGGRESRQIGSIWTLARTHVLTCTCVLHAPQVASGLATGGAADVNPKP
jgi:hypothetical protein